VPHADPASAQAGGRGATARITGAIRFVGGPARSGIERRRQGGRVTLVRDGRTIAAARVRHGHRFVLSAPPGRYRLAGRSGDATCRQRTVTLRSGATQHVDVVCAIR
jgi:hypothetical protein